MSNDVNSIWVNLVLRRYLIYNAHDVANIVNFGSKKIATLWRTIPETNPMTILGPIWVYVEEAICLCHGGKFQIFF